MTISPEQVTDDKRDRPAEEQPVVQGEQGTCDVGNPISSDSGPAAQHRHRRAEWEWRLRKLESGGMFALAALAFVWSVYLFWWEREDARQQQAEQVLERADRERLIKGQQDDISSRRTQNERLFAAALLPSIGCEYNVRQQAALELLSGYAPEQHMIVASLLLRDCPQASQTLREQLNIERAQSSVVELEQAFLAALDNAREYYRADLKERAAERFYNLATTRLPDRYARLVDLSELDRARRAFEGGAFSESADRYEAAFRVVLAAAVLPRR